TKRAAVYGGSNSKVSKSKCFAYSRAECCSVSTTPTRPLPGPRLPDPATKTFAQSNAVHVLPEPAGPVNATRAFSRVLTAGTNRPLIATTRYIATPTHGHSADTNPTRHARSMAHHTPHTRHSAP